MAVRSLDKWVLALWLANARKQWRGGRIMDTGSAVSNRYAEGESLRRLDDRPVGNDRGELRLFSVVRNEARRLPFFLSYYSARGVSRFFIADNDSTDGTTDLLLSKPDVHTFHAGGRYSQAGFGIDWLHTLLESFGRDHWCIIVDADEFFVYPGWEDLSIPDLCDYLDSEPSSAFISLLLDMYSDKPFVQTRYQEGTDPLALCPYFDTDGIGTAERFPSEVGGRLRHVGGMRKRVFGLDNVTLDKICLIRYASSIQLDTGMHAVGGASFSGAQGAVLHFKYLDDFGERARFESVRQEHWNMGVEYKRYREVLETNSELGAFTSASRLFGHSGDLVRHNIMKSTPDLDRVIEMKRRLRG